MKNLIKTIGLILVVTLFSGCCTFCKIDTLTEYKTDSVYYGDTIKVKTLNPINTENSVRLKMSLNLTSELLDSINRIYIIDSMKNNLWDSVWTTKSYVDCDIVMDTGTFINPYISSDTSIVKSAYAYSFAVVDGSNLMHWIYDKDSVEVVIDSLVKVINTTIINNTSYNAQYKDKFKTYRRIAWLFGVILLLILVYVVKIAFLTRMNNRS